MYPNKNSIVNYNYVAPPPLKPSYIEKEILRPKTVPFSVSLKLKNPHNLLSYKGLTFIVMVWTGLILNQESYAKHNNQIKISYFYHHEINNPYYIIFNSINWLGFFSYNGRHFKNQRRHINRK